MIINPYWFATSGTKTLTWKGTAASTANASTYTFASKDIGAADAARRVIVAAMTDGVNSGTTITSVTVGGVTCDEIIEFTNSFVCVGIYIANVPTGTTADIVVTPSAGKARAAVDWWITNDLSANTATATDSSTASPSSLVLSTTNGGFAVSCGMCNSTATALTFTGTNVTQRSNAYAESPNGRYATADATTNGSSLTITGTWTGTPGSGDAQAAASW